ncbi:MAG: polyprenyl synthetase family protein [Lachnospiraceae bacterium]|nr:polyprenyl synthetase family protein [Lachnospiraceae bacterium]
MTDEILRKKAEEIDGIIESYLPVPEGEAATVIKAMNYSIHAGGKRLRPLLMQEMYRMFGGKDDGVIRPFMAAIEMIHTYSLCHDDLPAMDNDDMRRGKKSTHAEFGEAMGILAGDGLLNYAFETALKAFDTISTNTTDMAAKTKRICDALSILAAKAGIYGMIGGQTADIESEERSDVSMETVRYIHENKTAAMIESSMMIGAVLAGASSDEVSAVERIASDVGNAFQIEDDILDVVGSDEALGKPVGSDEKNGKTTYVSLAGLEKAKADVRSLSERAVKSLGELGGAGTEDGLFLTELIKSLVERDR